MTAPIPGDVEAAVERLTKHADTLAGQRERGSAFPKMWGQDIIDANLALAQSTRTLLASHAAMAERGRLDAEALVEIANMGFAGAPDIYMRRIARARLQAREGGGS